MSDQLDLFHQPPQDVPGDPRTTPDAHEPGRVYQLAELPGDTWEDLFPRPNEAA